MNRLLWFVLVASARELRQSCWREKLKARLLMRSKRDRRP